MKINFTKSLLTLFVMAMTLSLSAQLNLDYIWGGPNSTGDELKNSTFDGGLNDWTTEGISCFDMSKLSEAIWKWTADGNLDGAYFGTSQIISSPSIANGAAYFDSDFLDNAGVQGDFGLGLCPSPQVSALLSPALDFTDESSVSICFYQSFRNFTTTTTVEASSDGGSTWTSFPVRINDYVPQNSAVSSDTSGTAFITIDLSSVLANASDARVRFIFDGGAQGYYFWTLDDVSFARNMKRDIHIVDVFVPAFSVMQPVSPGMGCDTMSFSCRVISPNIDVVTTDNYDFKVEVLDAAGTVLFTDNASLDSINFTEQQVVFSETWAPQNQEGSYTVQYSLVDPNGDDIINYNNDRDGGFTVTGASFDGVPGTIDDISWFYSLNPPTTVYSQFMAINTCDAVEAGIDVYVDNVVFSADWEGPTGSTAVGKSIEVYIEKAKDKSDWFPEDMTIDWISPLWDQKGYHKFEFSNENQLRSYISLNTFENEFGINTDIKIDTGSVYVICLVSQKDFSYGTGDYNNNARASGLIVDSGEFGGYGESFSVDPPTARILPIDIQVNLKFLDPDGTTSLLQDNALKVVQNPVNDELRLQMEFANSTRVAYALGSMTGRIISMGHWDNVQNRTETLDVSNLANGSYLIRIQTPEGIATKKFVVAK